MGENTKIEWANHTFNPWMGCTKVSPACAHCYAERDMDHRYGKVKWGPQGTRIRTADANWKKPLKWNRDAEKAGERRRVLCASLADIFEDWKGPIVNASGQRLSRVEGACEVVTTMDDARRDLFALIDKTPWLDYLLLTKRPENIRRMWRDVESTERTTCRRCGKEWRDRARQRGAVLESPKADWLSLDGRNSGDGVSSSARRNAECLRVFTNSRNAEQEEDLRRGASPSMASNERAYSEVCDDQSQERNQGRQQAGESGIGNDERAASSRSGSPQCSAQSTKGVEAPENKADRIGRACNEGDEVRRGEDQGYCLSIRHAPESCWCDCESPDLDSHLTYRSNVWLGCSVENQEYANTRIPELLKCRDLAPVLFLSMEPLLGEVDLTRIQTTQRWPRKAEASKLNALSGFTYSRRERFVLNGIVEEKGEAEFVDLANTGAIDWVIAGGESGPDSRPSHPDWFRSVRDQCAAAGVPFHFKQWGEWAEASPSTPEELLAMRHKTWTWLDRNGESGFTFGTDDRACMERVGKKAAGRLLDGIEHNEFPEVQNA